MQIQVSGDMHFAECAEEFEQAIAQALERIGMAAESNAKIRCTVDTGNLRNSITHEVTEREVTIGTNVEYGKYVEHGTGVHAESGGRQTPWIYQDGKGEWHLTNGAQPKPFLRPAVSEHQDEYRAILEDSLKGGV